MKTSIRTLTLSVRELAEIIAVEDAETRRQMLEALSNPETVAETEPDADTAPATAIIVRTIRKKTEQMARRRQTRQRRKLEKDAAVKPSVKSESVQTAAESPQTVKPAEPVEMLIDIPWNNDSLNFVNFVRKSFDELDRNFRRFFRLIKETNDSPAIIDFETKAMYLLDMFKRTQRNASILRCYDRFPNQTITIKARF